MYGNNILQKLGFSVPVFRRNPMSVGLVGNIVIMYLVWFLNTFICLEREEKMIMWT